MPTGSSASTSSSPWAGVRSPCWPTDRQRTRGALIQVHPEDTGITLTLGPLRTVKASFIASESEAAVPAEVAFYVGEAKPRFGWGVGP